MKAKLSCIVLKGLTAANRGRVSCIEGAPGPACGEQCELAMALDWVWDYNVSSPPTMAVVAVAVLQLSSEFTSLAQMIGAYQSGLCWSLRP